MDYPIKTSEMVMTNGSYRGIPFEVNHPHDSYKFTYYVFLNLELFDDRELADSLWMEAQPFELFPSRKFCNYSQNEFLTEIEFHGGITWYSKMFSGNDDRIIKIGCDYGHSFDEGRYRYGGVYYIEEILSEVKATIDSIHGMVTYFFRCGGDGHLCKESDGAYFKYSFYSKEYAAKQGWELPVEVTE